MATDVAKLAYMFDIKVFDDGGSGQKNPTRAYVRKHDVYAEYLIADENEETFKTICKNMLKTIIDLYSIIQITMPTAYGSGFGKLKMVKIGQKPLYYKQQILPYKVPEGITLILLAGFRVCCDFDSNNEIYFKYDPIKLYSIIKDDIVKEAIKFIQSNQKEGTKTTETQRNEMWRVMALSVSNKLLKLERSGIIKPVVNKNNLLTFEDYMKNN